MSSVSSLSIRQNVINSLRTRKSHLENEKAWYQNNKRKDKKISIIESVIKNLEALPKAENVDLTCHLTDVEKESLFVGYFRHATKDLFLICQKQLDEEHKNAKTCLSDGFPEVITTKMSNEFLSLRETFLFCRSNKAFNALLKDNNKKRLITLSNQISPYLKDELIQDNGLINGKERIIAFSTNPANHKVENKLLSLNNTPEDIIFLSHYIECGGSFKKYPNILINAARDGHTEIVRLLIRAKADLNIKNNGNTALIWAAYKGHTEIVRLIIQAKVDLNIKNNIGNTALIWAAYKGHTEIVRLIIQARPNLNIKSNNGSTALILAAFKGHTEIVRLLIRAKADLNIKNNDGKIAYEIAISANRFSAAEIIKQAQLGYIPSSDND